jgi:hypothetical protein
MMKNIKLLPNWQEIARQAWSIKFAVLSGICSAGEVAISYFPDSLPRGAMAGLAGSFALIGIVSRFIMQKSLNNEN